MTLMTQVAPRRASQHPISLERGKRRIKKILEENDDPRNARAFMFDAELALAALTTNNNHRKPNADIVAQMRRDMEGGNWFLGDGMIIFDKFGQMRNGQHRLIALSTMVNLQIELMVRCGVSEEEVQVFDRGWRRSDRQAMDFTETASDFPRDTRHAAAPLIKQMINGGQMGVANTYSSTTIMQLAEKYADDVEFLMNVLRQGDYRVKKPSVAVLSVFLSAYFWGANRDDLAYALRYVADQFAISRGVLEVREGCAILEYLRSVIDQPLKTGAKSGGNQATRLRWVTGRALYGFLTRDGMEKFPIDGKKPEAYLYNFFPIDGKIELPADSLIQQQVDVMTNNHMMSLIAWASAAEPEKNYRVKEMAKWINDRYPYFRTGGFKRALSETVSKFGEIRLENLGRLHPGAKKGETIDEYFFTRNEY